MAGWRTNNAFTMIRTWLHGERVGEDEHGNRYYRERGRARGRRERRWVVFAGTADATAVPPGWNGWLQSKFDKPPSEAPLAAKPWEEERLPNATGTAGAYLPPGAVQRGGHRAPATGDYESWRPE